MGSGPLKIWIEGGDMEALRSRAKAEGLALAESGEDADLVARITGPLNAIDEKTIPRLSRREAEILDYLADGWSNAEIASALRIGQRTVRFHLEGIYGKLGVSRRGEAVREAISLGLVRFEV